MTDEATRERALGIVDTMRSILEAVEALPTYADSLARTVPLTQMRMLLRPGELEVTLRIAHDSLLDVGERLVFDDQRWNPQHDEPPSIADVLHYLIDWLGFIGERAPKYLGNLDYLERALQPALVMLQQAAQTPTHAEVRQGAAMAIAALDEDEGSGVHHASPPSAHDFDAKALVMEARAQSVRQDFEHLPSSMLRELAAEALVLADRKDGVSDEVH